MELKLIICKEELNFKMLHSDIQKILLEKFSTIFLYNLILIKLVLLGNQDVENQQHSNS